MLVLCRRRGEAVVVPGLGITLTVVSIRGNEVRLGFSAPDDVRCFRQELWQRIKARQGTSVVGLEATK